MDAVEKNEYLRNVTTKEVQKLIEWKFDKFYPKDWIH